MFKDFRPQADAAEENIFFNFSSQSFFSCNLCQLPLFLNWDFIKVFWERITVILIACSSAFPETPTTFSWVWDAEKNSNSEGKTYGRILSSLIFCLHYKEARVKKRNHLKNGQCVLKISKKKGLKKGLQLSSIPFRWATLHTCITRWLQLEMNSLRQNRDV